ncbi:MAG: 4-hydroxy-tetrahydrodipicolinate reductase [Flavobacteriales bacterium]|nr:4-hydroxy-tetrahydrodipicolinate reductase [Flavobacteriales bacterium]|tara:strand:+ start:143 stop:805 length:663 start_codon:yes stop_codon:yes gene_type:complete
MNIALIGYGKMGQLIEQIAIEKGHSITVIVNSSNPIENHNFNNVDVAIDFSTPKSAFQNIKFILSNRIPVVSGTTGWLNDIDKARKLANAKEIGFIYSSNFSIGVNIFFELNKRLSQLMQNHLEYKPSIKEIHHKSKIDSPSGTALSLHSQMSSNIEIESERTENIPGTHIVNYDSKIDSISITHRAHNRMGFVSGALIAAEWIIDKKGSFSMSDILKTN